MNGYLLTRKIKHKHLVKVRSFSGAKISCMTDHVKPTLRDINPDHIILHAGTNDLRTENTASQIAKATIDLATSLINDDNTVTVSGIVPRLDDLNNKANEMNRRLVLMCKERNISFLSHDESIDPNKHLNESKLHLNSNGIKIFAENFSRFLVKLNWRQQRKTNLNTSISLDLDKKSHSCETPNKGSTESAQTGDPKEILKNLRLKNVNRLICAQLNINSIANKFDSLVNVVNSNIDILMIWETKLDRSFPTGQFHIHDFSEPYRFHRNSNGLGIFQYIPVDIPSKLILTKMTIERDFLPKSIWEKKAAPLLFI